VTEPARMWMPPSLEQKLRFCYIGEGGPPSLGSFGGQPRVACQPKLATDASERRLVRKGGFEPPRSCERQPLKPVRLSNSSINTAFFDRQNY
jgi:hypothetical protein